MKRIPLALLALLPLALACGDKDGDDSGTADDTQDNDDHDDMDMDAGMDTGAVDYGTTQDSDGGTYSVTWSSEPDPVPFNELFTVGVTVTPDAMPEGGFTVSRIDATMPAHGHGMNVAPVVTDNGDGTATASPFQFHMEGLWQIEVDVDSDAGTETATFSYMCCE